MARIGVVVPVYNTKEYLRKCIDSILNQTFKDIELVLVDDGSTDGSGEICDSYTKDPRVRVIHQENQGMIKARLNGFKALNSEYASSVDSDDWILENTYEYLSQYLDKRYDVISFNIVRYFSEKKQIESRDRYKCGLYTKNNIISDIFPTMIWDIHNEKYGLDPSICNKLIRMDLFLKYLNRASVLSSNYGQDCAILYPLMSEAESLLFSDKYFYFHRQRKNGEIAEYMSEVDFYRKTFELYEYLMAFYINNKDLCKQIEFFYSHSLEIRLEMLYGETAIKRFYLFPFNNVEKGERIVIYGAGKVGQSYYEQLQKTMYCEIVAIVDRCRSIFIEGRNVLQIDDINSLKFDHIIVATIHKDNIHEMINALVDRGVNTNKIICPYLDR
ncbi:hypothetical protein BXO88_09065 [Oribacterium sp. C9]|uniref:glycosyltransferase n=1 Tax=Oribacterium sp. C9 TaxID=1943579 RepID=UPI00098FA6DD|nr:glycosyltransferase [Oribacterium sp. C9]OON86185.1 hypothetical protein BXO88_09065 [Oribacterium sp. C9]